MPSHLLYAFVVGAALLALWIDARHPKLAPESFSRRMIAAGCAFVLLEAMPIFQGSSSALYATLFAIMLPVMIASFLTAAWLLRALRDTQLSH
jgi:hypothetical protein